jgi:general secretion pathway protein E
VSAKRATAEADTVGVIGPPSEAFLRLIPRDFARQHLILSVGNRRGIEHLLRAETTGEAALFNTGVRLAVPIEARAADAELIARAVDDAYAAAGRDDDTAEFGTDHERAGSLQSIEALLERADRDLLSTQGKGPVVQLVDALLFEALGRDASDVHVQPLADRTLVRYRVDGVLHTARELSPKLTAAVVSRIKVMGRMDIAERRVPQDGRATVTIGDGRDGAGRAIDLRISTLPTSYGERAVIRLLDNSSGRWLDDFASLGMPIETERAYLAGASRSNGIVLVTGPTGSGKTTTLYTTLRWLAGRGCRSGRGGELNITTIEDPIEYELSTAGIAISQAQVNTKKGVTFAKGLRHILRQDPDVVMVGEIRDTETARIAIQASLTGHLVFSTLHTNDAVSTVTRLVDLGVEAYLVSASLSAVLAQRLVRTTHKACNGAGCEGCFGSGLLGRTGLYELLVIDDELRELISGGATASRILAAARSRGTRSLADEGERLIKEGTTGRVEVERVVRGGLNEGGA